MPIGGDGAVCVKTDDYGVVYITESRNIHCATCHYGKTDCKHIRKLKCVIDTIMSEETAGIPEVEQFQEIFYGSKTQKGSTHYLTCLSSVPIPFEPLPETLSNKLQPQALQQRLNIVEGVCFLTPDWKPCPLCQLDNWSKEEFSDCSVVLSNQFLPAKGEISTVILYYIQVIVIKYSKFCLSNTSIGHTLTVMSGARNMYAHTRMYTMTYLGYISYHCILTCHSSAHHLPYTCTPDSQ